jgi:hypothetical protein
MAHEALLRALKYSLDNDLRNKIYPKEKKLKEFFYALDTALSMRWFSLQEIGVSKEEMSYYKNLLQKNRVTSSSTKARSSKR